MAISVKLNVFEGPLDLLLHLIDKNKIDIYDISVETMDSAEVLGNAHQTFHRVIGITHHPTAQEKLSAQGRCKHRRRAEVDRS